MALGLCRSTAGTQRLLCAPKLLSPALSATQCRSQAGIDMNMTRSGIGGPCSPSGHLLYTKPATRTQKHGQNGLLCRCAGTGLTHVHGRYVVEPAWPCGTITATSDDPGSPHSFTSSLAVQAPARNKLACNSTLAVPSPQKHNRTTHCL